MAEQARIRVAVMHAEHLVDAGLTATLARQPGLEIVALHHAVTRDSRLLLELRAQGVDIVVADYDSGIWLARASQQVPEPLRAPCSRIMIVTGRVTQVEIRSALKLGVGGYLTITSPSAEIVDAVREVYMGMRHVTESLARSLLEDLLGERLTPRESEVLQLAAQGCANKVIAARLRVELGTVKCHMKAILDKLRASNRTEAVIIASQRGLLAAEVASYAVGVRAGAAAPPWAHPAAASASSTASL